MGETSTLACLFGAAILIAVGIGSWRIMAGCVVGALGLGTLLWMSSNGSGNPMMYLPALLASGDRRLCVRHRLYGDRPGLGGDDRPGTLDLRHPHRRDDRPRANDQPGLPRGDHAGDLVRQRNGSAH